jgi:YVTN family beta-propeller protein
VSVIDTVTNTVTATIPVGPIPYGVAVTPNGAYAYVTIYGATAVSVIDTATDTVTATIPVGGAPYTVAITPDGTQAYVTNSRSNTVSVIDTATDTVTATIPVGKNPVGVAVTPTVTPPPPPPRGRPSLTIAMNYPRHLVRGKRGDYTFTVGNKGNAVTNGATVIVHDVLPRGLTARGISGRGWRCRLRTLTCTRGDILADSHYPPIRLIVQAQLLAPATVTNIVRVTGGGDTITHTATGVTHIDRGSRRHH